MFKNGDRDIQQTKFFAKSINNIVVIFKHFHSPSIRTEWYYPTIDGNRVICFSYAIHVSFKFTTPL